MLEVKTMYSPSKVLPLLTSLMKYANSLPSKMIYGLASEPSPLWNEAATVVPSQIELTTGTYV